MLSRIKSATNQREIELPLAPLPEQRRIVEAIESYLTRLDAVVAALGRVQRNLARYKASVLQAACEGRLVPTEAELAHERGRDYEHAEVLLQRILAERRAHWERRMAEARRSRQEEVAQAERKAAGRPYYFRDIPEEVAGRPRKRVQRTSPNRINGSRSTSRRSRPTPRICRRCRRGGCGRLRQL